MTTPSSDDRTHARDRTPSANGPEHMSVIASSHSRSRTFGLLASDRPDYHGASANAIHSLREENHFLYQHAAPVMETLYEQIANTHSMVLLTTRMGHHTRLSPCQQQTRQHEPQRLPNTGGSLCVQCLHLDATVSCQQARAQAQTMPRGWHNHGME